MKLLVGLLTVIPLLTAVMSSNAQSFTSLPLEPKDAHVDSSRSVVSVVVIALRESESRTLSAARQECRKRAARLAREKLHRYIDDVLAARREHPKVATAFHEVLDEHAKTSGSRPLIDGGVMMRVDVPIAELCRAKRTRHAPWSC